MSEEELIQKLHDAFKLICDMAQAMQAVIVELRDAETRIATLEAESIVRKAMA